MRRFLILATFFATTAGLEYWLQPALPNERGDQCRQDGQTDVVSIQLNIEFNCYCETDSECEAR
jgi:hypothetical protein